MTLRSLPYELNLAIEGLNNKQRQEILFALEDSDKLSFSELAKNVNIEGSLLANHLKVLVKTLLVEHYYDHKIGNTFSYYQISELGKTILHNLLGSLYVKIEKTRVYTICYRVEEKETTTFFEPFKANSKNKVSSVSSGLETEIKIT